MADNVAITAGTGTTIATDERTINSIAAQVQRVDEQASTNLANGQVNCSNTAATLLAARDTRKRVTFLNKQLSPVFIGIATVTTGNGFQLDPGASVTMYTQVLIQAITSAASGATEKVHYWEEYDL
jgi:hypothetical protein